MPYYISVSFTFEHKIYGCQGSICFEILCSDLHECSTFFGVSLSLKIIYFANQFQVWLAIGQNSVAFLYAIMNKLNPGCCRNRLPVFSKTSLWLINWVACLPVQILLILYTKLLLQSVVWCTKDSMIILHFRLILYAFKINSGKASSVLVMGYSHDYTLIF